ncbi:hypothetical protein TNCV_1843991 [Trichonephila clavipes]|nr:hypothetical protein TNCV_1843991 [Trichonephila clavipes]
MKDTEDLSVRRVKSVEAERPHGVEIVEGVPAQNLTNGRGSIVVKITDLWRVMNSTLVSQKTGRVESTDAC